MVMKILISELLKIFRHSGHFHWTDYFTLSAFSVIHICVGVPEVLIKFTGHIKSTCPHVRIETGILLVTGIC